MISAVFSLLARIVLGVASVLLVLWLLAVALIVALGLTLWRLLRGQKPGFSAFLHVRRQAQRGPWQGRAPQWRREMADVMVDVVDVEAREVPEARPPLR